MIQPGDRPGGAGCRRQRWPTHPGPLVSRPLGPPVSTNFARTWLWSRKHPFFITLLGLQGKNQADRFLVEAIIRALIDLQENGTNATDSGRVVELVELVAPLGDKRKLNLIDTRQNPTLDPSWLPKYRHVQSSEVSAVSDHLGVQLAHRNISGESERSEDKVKVLNTSVEILFKDLNDLINEHDRTTLLPWLMSQAEAILHEFRSAGLFAKQEIACFDDAPGVIRRLMDRNSKATSANTSIRFLIELVGAGSSSGTAPPSLTTLDRMMALVS
ncbi:MAG: hypothetical protein IH960_03330 [Chloroflexi bacterium]|nr:hypothetical protein [Chloroflexota bacterium]